MMSYDVFYMDILPKSRIIILIEVAMTERQIADKHYRLYINISFHWPQFLKRVCQYSFSLLMGGYFRKSIIPLI